MVNAEQETIMNKKIISIVLALAMIFSIVPAVFASGESAGEKEMTHVHDFITYKTNGTGDGDTEGTIKITVEGASVVFENKPDEFSGTAEYDDVLAISLVEQPGRTFKYWKSTAGVTISEKSFRLLAREDAVLWPVFEDTDASSFGEWVLVEDGNCEEGKLYKRENADGEVEYKREYVNGGMHDYRCEYKDDEYHTYTCVNCGFSYDDEHRWSDETILKEATHEEEGRRIATCSDCGTTIETTIPKTEEHVFGPWEIIEKSENGEYGVRRRPCLYCDYYEDYWYLEADWRPLLQDNHYLRYVESYGGKTIKDERYFSFKNDEGNDVYLFAFQYCYSYSSNEDGNQTFIYMFTDDGNPDTLKPVYLSKSGADSGYMGGYLWAHYGYVHDYDEWLETIKHMDSPAGCSYGMMVIGNSMSARNSQFYSMSNYWADEYNKLSIPVSEDPDSFLSENGGDDYKWVLDSDDVVIGERTYYVNDEEIHTGGFHAKVYKRWVSNSGDSKLYDYYYVDKATGTTVEFSTRVTAYRTDNYVAQYVDILTEDEYALIDDQYKNAYRHVGEIESQIKEFCSSRTYFSRFTLDVPETLEAVRVLYDLEYMYEDYGIRISANNTNTLYNPAKVFYTSGNPITFTWEDGDAASDVFDYWVIFNFATQTWDKVSESKTMTINTSDNPLTEATYVAAVTHKPPVSDVKYHIEVTENGYFLIEGDSTEYTEADVPENTKIELIVYYIDGKNFDHWENNLGEPLESRYVIVSEDQEFTPVFVDAEYEVYYSAYNGNGTVWSDNDPEPSTDKSVLGVYGSTFNLHTAGDEENGYTEFLGWYRIKWGKSGETFELLSSEKDYTLEITPENRWETIYAVWSDGTINIGGEPEVVKVDITDGFISARIFTEESGVFPPLYVSSLDVEAYSELTIVDDPSDDIRIGKWTVSYVTEGGPQSDELEVDFSADYEPETYYFVSDVENYVGKAISITGTPVTICEFHNWAKDVDTISWSEIKEATHLEEGQIKYVCTICGEEHYDTIPKTEEHTFGEWVDSEDGEHHHRSCECGETETAEHIWNEGEVTTYPTETEQGVKTYTCTVCGATRTENVDPLPHVHDLDHVEAKDPTCTESGNYEHWKCKVCGKLFTDELGENETTESELTISALNHNYSDEWLSDESGHWHKCTRCDSVTETEAHVFGAYKNNTDDTTYEGHYHECEICSFKETSEHTWDNGTVTTDPTETEDGVITYTCTVCGATKEGIIDATGHSLVFHEANDPTCTETGNTAYYSCETCDKFFADSEAATEIEENSWIIDKLDHDFTGDWGYDETGHWRKCTRCDAVSETENHEFGDWTCAETFVGHSRTCADCGYTETADHEESEWQHDENSHYKYCSVCESNYSEAEHTWDNGTVTTEALCETGGTVLYTCEICGETKEEHVDALEHNFIVHERNEASCEEDGNELYLECSRCHKFFRNDNDHTEIEENSWIIEATGHEWGEPEYTWANDYSTVTARVICTHDSSHVISETVKTTAVRTEPTFDSPGKVVYTAAFTNSAFTSGAVFEAQQTEQTLAKLEYKWSQPTYEWSEDYSTVTASRYSQTDPTIKESETAETTSETVEATKQSDGKTTYTAVFNNPAFKKQVKVVVLPKLDGSSNDDIYRFALALRMARERMNAAINNETGNDEGKEPEVDIPDEWKNPFTDISENDSYYDAVRFVNENGLFLGVSEDKFAPEAPMTRGMFVTVLGRFSGVSEDTVNTTSFKDVEDGQWYTPYVAWASENGIIKGYSSSKFGIGDDVTVEQAAVILARYAEYLGLATSDEEDTINSFEDSDDVSDWAVEGMRFVVKNGIYVPKETLNPNKKATRALVAEMIYNFSKWIAD